MKLFRQLDGRSVSSCQTAAVLDFDVLEGPNWVKTQMGTPIPQLPGVRSQASNLGKLEAVELDRFGTCTSAKTRRADSSAAH